MAEELTAADVEAYTNGRLLASDPETQRALDAALARIRRYCGWHVSPVRTDTVILDGPGCSVLELPTLHIVSIDEVHEYDNEVDLTTITQIREAPGWIAKKSCAHWVCGYSAIEVEFTHGYSALEAADFREAVLALIDRASQSVGEAGGGAQLVEKEVDDVRYRWSDKVTSLTLDESAVSQFRILPV